MCDYRESTYNRTISAAARLNCSHTAGIEAMVDCLRSLPADVILESGLPSSRLIDGDFVNGTAYEMLKSGVMEGVDYMGGW